MTQILQHLIDTIAVQMRIWPQSREVWMDWVGELANHPETAEVLAAFGNATAAFFQHIEDAKAGAKAKRSGLN